jgi:hypothetical protein
LAHKSLEAGDTPIDRKGAIAQEPFKRPAQSQSLRHEINGEICPFVVSHVLSQHIS